jgi:hypothetical protein
MEKYATTPEVGKDSYENGLGAVGCICFLSPRRPVCRPALKSDDLGIGSLEAGCGTGIVPGLLLIKPL